MTKVNAYRKKSASVIDPYKFSSTGSIIDLTGLTRYTDQELTAAIPNISASNNLNTALKILDGQIRKVNSNIPDLNTLATVARTGSYTDLSNKPTIPTATSQLTNDSGYLTSVGWTDVTGKPTSFTPSSHNQASNTINAMTGYTKASASASISTTDSLNTAIGKLEYGLGTKLDSGATAKSANKLATSRTIALTGAVTGSGTFNGSADLNIATTLSGIDASKITSGTIDIARIPKAAISNLKVVSDDTARFKLTISDVQNGDTVKVTGTGKMYYVADDTKLAEEAGYEIYNATTDWDSITNKPTSYTPAAHTQAASTITGLASVATTGSYNDLSNKPTIPSKVSQLTNDSGYLTTVSWNTVTNKPSTYTPAAHNQASNTINAMTGYAKPSTTSAIATTDSLNTAIGKLEYGLGTKLDSGATAAKATADAAGQTISTTYIKDLSVSGKVITYTKGDGSTGTITTQDTNTTYSPMKGATSSADGAGGLVPVPTAGNQTKYLRADGTWSTPTDTNTTYSAGTGISLSGTTFSNAGVRSVAAGSSANQLSVNTGGTTTTITVDNVANATAATKATQDYAGQRIDTTYIKGLSVSGKTITYTKGDGTTGTITTQDTDTKYSVMTGATADAAGSNGLVPAPAKGKQTSFLRGDGTWVVPTNTTYSAGTGISLSGTTINNSGVRSVVAGSSANQLSVNTNGTTSTITINNVANATAAGSATKATQDSDGQQINTTYIKGLSVSGKTITYTKGDGTTGTITTQDTNTTYSKGTYNYLGLIKPSKSYTGAATLTTAAATATTAPKLAAITTNSDRYYAVEMDTNGVPFVNVPWVNTDTNTTYSAGAGISLSGTTFSNSGVRSIAAGSSANQISVNTGGTETTITVNNVANATAADKLKTGRTITLSGAITGSATFDGSANKTISTTLSNFDASKITSGTIDIARLPKAAIPELKIVADDTARFALTTSDIQNGDTVQVTSTGKMYYVKDQTKLSSEDGYAVYTAGAASSVPWSGVTGKPSSYTPAAHTQAASTITGLATVATSGSYADLSNKPTIPSKVSQLTNDSGYITGVSWSQVSNKPTSFTPNSHNQASNTITALTGYSKPSSTGAIGTSDSLNAALGKLEKGLDGKLSTSGTAAKASTLAIEAGTADASRYVIFQESANSTSVLSACYDADFKYNPVSNVLTVGSITGNAATATKATQDSAGQQINTTYIKGLAVSGKTITYTKGDGTTGTITTQDTNTTYTKGTYNYLGLIKPSKSYTGAATLTTAAATTSTAPTISAITTTAGRYYAVEMDSNGVPFVNVPWVDTNTNTTYSAGTGISLSGTTFSNAGVRSVVAGSSANQLSVNTGGTTATITINNVANATAAGSATKATQDSAGQQINTTYIKGLSVSGKTITYTKGDGTTGTITTQDTNTTYSAFKGATANADGGTGLVPAPAKGAQTKYLRADGTWQTPPDTNTTYSASNGISLSGTTFSNSGVRSIATGSSNGTISVNTNGTTANVAVKGLGSAAYSNTSAFATASHTHNYAGSSSAGGAATKAIQDGDGKTISSTYAKLSGATFTGDVVMNTPYRDTYYASNLCRHFSPNTPNQFVVKTKIKYASGTHMPVVRIYGYAYGLESPIELRVGFYIYDNKLGWAGVSCTGAWKPEVYLFSYTENSVKYVAIGFKGSCYFCGFQVDAQIGASGDFNSYFAIDGWRTENNGSNTSTNIIPSVGTNDCIKVDYKPMQTDITGNASTATKATQDSAGQQINTTYIKGLSVSGKTITYTKGDGTTGTITTQDTNTTYSAGTGISLSGTSFSNAGVRSIAAGSSANQLSVNTGGTTSTITINNVANATSAGSATKATQDSAGQQINTTYIKGLSVSGTTITYTKGDGTTGTIKTQDTNTDTKVTQSAVTDAEYTNYRSLVWGSANSGTKDFTPSTVTDSVYTCKGLYVQPSSGLIHATTFEGALSGNAATATKATQDSAGQQINTTYIKGLSVSGKTITYTKGDGTTGTITTQDTNTTYSAFKGATSSAAGGTGLVPAPAKGAQTKYLRADGTWQTPPDTNTTYSVFKGATSSAAGGTGLVPAPAAGAQAKYLRADGTWQTPPDTNTTYSAATSSNLGLVKIGSNISVSSGTISLTKANITNALGYTPPTTDTNTHYTTHAKVGASATATANAAASNGSVYLNILDDSTVRDSHLIKGAGATTVTSDANGVITISSTDTNTNTTYSAGTGISLSGTTFSNAGVRSIATGSTNGTISVNTNGTVNNIAVKGLGSAAYSNTSAFAAASHSHSNYALKTDIPSVWDSSGHLVSPAGWKLWVAD